MGKFRSGVTTVIAMWSFAAHAQAQDAPRAPQGNQEVFQRLVEELSGAYGVDAEIEFVGTPD